MQISHVLYWSKEQNSYLKNAIMQEMSEFNIWHFAWTIKNQNQKSNVSVHLWSNNWSAKQKQKLYAKLSEKQVHTDTLLTAACPFAWPPDCHLYYFNKRINPNENAYQCDISLIFFHFDWLLFDWHTICQIKIWYLKYVHVRYFVFM